MFDVKLLRITEVACSFFTCLNTCYERKNIAIFIVSCFELSARKLNKDSKETDKCGLHVVKTNAGLSNNCS